MKVLTFTLLSLLITSIVDVSFAFEPIRLTNKTFNEEIAEGTWFINFMLPYCIHCQNLAPIWSSLAENHQSLIESSKFHIAEVDCSLDGDLADAFTITHTPTLLLFSNGKKIEKYSGPKDYESLAKYIISKADDYNDFSESGEPEESSSPEDIDRKLSVQSESPNSSGKVIVLDSNNFDNLTKTDPWFVKFFAPWCPHCKNLAPTWEELASKLQGQINIGEVDCTIQGDLCNRFEVHGYPTLKMILGDETIDYKGSRKLPDLLAFAEKAVNARIKEITAAEFEQSYKKKPVSFIYLYDDNSPSQILGTLDTLARSFFSTAKIYSSKDPQLLTELKINKVPQLVVIKDDIQKSYPDKASDAFYNVDSLKAWINQEKWPILNALSSENSEEILNGERLVVLGVFDPKAGKTYTKAKSTLKNIARRYFSQVKRRGGSEDGRPVIFAWLDGTKWSDYIYQIYGLSLNDLPAVLINDPKAEQYYDKLRNGEKLSLDNTEELFNAIHDVKKGLLTGTSTISFVERAVKHSYQKASNHPFITFVLIIVSLASIWRFCLSGLLDDTKGYNSPERGYPKFE